MTIEDINYQLSNLREDVEYLLGRTEQSDIYLKALDMAMSALRVQQEAEKNEPLKLEQLLEMDGQPVWVEHPSGYKHYNGWALVFVSWKVQEQVRVTYATGGSGNVSLLLDDGAKIYRHPPKEAHDA